MFKPIKIKEKTLKYKGHNLLISAIQYTDPLHLGQYEVGVFDLDDDFEEKEMIHPRTIEDCKFYFDKFVKKYTEKKVAKEDTPIPKRYLKFANDYAKVYDSCKEVFSQGVVDDGGASNFDTCTVFIGKRLKKGFLDAVLKPRHLKAHIDGDLIFVAVPFTQYQGFGNTAQAEYMSKMFRNLGYESSVFYRID